MDQEQIENQVKEGHVEGLYHLGQLVGYVGSRPTMWIKNLSTHVVVENLVSKASSVLSLMHLVKNSGINPDEIDYVIDCSEEACGDMNQRGGGNFAKAAAEIAGLKNATRSTSAPSARPAHALVTAASLVKSAPLRRWWSPPAARPPNWA